MDDRGAAIKKRSSPGHFERKAEFQNSTVRNLCVYDGDEYQLFRREPVVIPKEEPEDPFAEGFFKEDGFYPRCENCGKV